MVVADALSRAVDVVNVSLFEKDTDPWYQNIIKGIVINPDEFEGYKYENNLLYKFCSVNPKIIGQEVQWRIVVSCK